MKGLFLSVMLMLVVGLGFEPLGMIRYEEINKQTEIVELHTNLLNTGEKDLFNVYLTAYIPDLDIRVRTRQFDLGDNEKVSKTMLLDIPANAEPGCYLMSISTRNEDEFRSKAYREICIE